MGFPQPQSNTLPIWIITQTDAEVQQTFEYCFNIFVKAQVY